MVEKRQKNCRNVGIHCENETCMSDGQVIQAANPLLSLEFGAGYDGFKTDSGRKQSACEIGVNNYEMD